jgi:hypothetical protein
MNTDDKQPTSDYTINAPIHDYTTNAPIHQFFPQGCASPGCQPIFLGSSSPQEIKITPPSLSLTSGVLDQIRMIVREELAALLPKTECAAIEYTDDLGCKWVGMMYRREG